MSSSNLINSLQFMKNDIISRLQQMDLPTEAPPNAICLQSLSLDCIHLIFHYHIFDLQQLEEDYGFSWGKQMASADAYKNHRFMQKFAHCCSELPDKMARNKFLKECRDMSVKPVFHHLEIYHDTYDELCNYVHSLTGVKQLELTIESGLACYEPEEMDTLFEHLRGVSKLHLETSLGLESQHFEALRGIKELQLKYCDLSEISAEDFQNLRGIKVLRLMKVENLEITDAHLQNLRGIEELVLSGCDLESLSRDAFQNLRGIRVLRLDHCEDAPLTSESFKNLRGIKELQIDNRLHYPYGNEHLQQLRGIQDLHICFMGNLLTHESLKSLRGIKNLHLACHPSFENQSVTDAAIGEIQGNIKNLTLMGLFGITSACFEHLKGVENLRLDICPNVAFEASSLAHLRGHLKSLDWMTGNESSSLKVLHSDCLRMLSSVKHLTLDRVITVSDEAFQHLTNIKSLNLRGDYEFKYDMNPLGEEAFYSMKHVKDIQLYCLRLDRVSNFSNVHFTLLLSFPPVETFEIVNCRCLRSSLMFSEGIPLQVHQAIEAQNDRNYVVATVTSPSHRYR